MGEILIRRVFALTHMDENLRELERVKDMNPDDRAVFERWLSAKRRSGTSLTAIVQNFYDTSMLAQNLKQIIVSQARKIDPFPTETLRELVEGQQDRTENRQKPAICIYPELYRSENQTNVLFLTPEGLFWHPISCPHFTNPDASKKEERMRSYIDYFDTTFTSIAKLVLSQQAKHLQPFPTMEFIGDRGAQIIRPGILIEPFNVRRTPGPVEYDQIILAEDGRLRLGYLGSSADLEGERQTIPSYWWGHNELEANDTEYVQYYETSLKALENARSGR